ncbi:unnamed protein product [Cylicostephanus goldi]|uniref:Uncharacterized protein n=1 Tax=Cylicostephanus goldi TaxID=71465 RepID=A0A3P6Q2C5_CYLGO|nr:unnamed protein product [Cylicostephanus goldi]
MANRVELIEKEVKDLTVQEKNFKALLMVSAQKYRIPLYLYHALYLYLYQDMTEEFGHQAKQMESKVRRDVTRDKREKNMLYEIAHRERIESEMRDAYLKQADKGTLSARGVLNEIANRIERMERDTRSVDEIANRVQCIEKELAFHGSGKKGDNASLRARKWLHDIGKTFVGEDNLSVMTRMRREVGEYAAQDAHQVLLMETEKAPKERGSKSSQSGLSSLENVRIKETELRSRNCVFFNGNHWQEHGRRYSSSS